MSALNLTTSPSNGVKRMEGNAKPRNLLRFGDSHYQMKTKFSKTLIPFMLSMILAFCYTMGQEKDVCPKKVATLAPLIGSPYQASKGERVEIRQCFVTETIGSFQILAWERGATSPSLMIDREQDELRQLVMIPGAYAFEIPAASATTVIGIVYQNGHARKAVEDSTKDTITIKSNGNSIIIQVVDGNKKRAYTLKRDLTYYQKSKNDTDYKDQSSSSP
jgi:hypothetical protein